MSSSELQKFQDAGQDGRLLTRLGPNASRIKKDVEKILLLQKLFQMSK